MSAEDWADERGERALSRAEALSRTRDAETRRASAMVRDFAAKAIQTGLKPTRFAARSYDGRVRYRTHLHGWYLKKDRSVGVGTDGQFYVLSAPRRFRSRLMGAEVPPADPPLELGRGARDGESLPLQEALDKRLAAGDDWR